MKTNYLFLALFILHLIGFVLMIKDSHGRPAGWGEPEQTNSTTQEIK